jgi:hypothetical protein
VLNAAPRSPATKASFIRTTTDDLGGFSTAESIKAISEAFFSLEHVAHHLVTCLTVSSVSIEAQ